MYIYVRNICSFETDPRDTACIFFFSNTITCIFFSYLYFFFSIPPAKQEDSPLASFLLLLKISSNNYPPIPMRVCFRIPSGCLKPQVVPNPIESMVFPIHTSL